MPKGTPLSKILSKETFMNLYQKNGSIEGISRETGYEYKTIYKHNDYAFSTDNEQSAYWAGFIAADGCIKEKN